MELMHRGESLNGGANDNVVGAYCDCKFPQCVQLTTYKGHIPDLVTCRCGEDEDYHSLHWQWERNENADTLINQADITFHPVYSQGTAIVRGNRALKEGYIHYWEIRVITLLSGTDVMFGIGTDKIDVDKFKFHFVSALGTNAQSWGFSYHGKIQHNGEQLPYGQRFSQGSIVGVYLDRSRGYLEFYLNRRSLGIAYTNIPLDPNIKLYPMVCSTAAKSVVRLINSISQPDCLQLRAFRALSKQPKALQQLHEMPGLRNIMRSYWFFAPPVRYSRYSDVNELDIADEAVLSQGRLKRKHGPRNEEVDLDDLYTNAHKIALHHSETEETCNASEYFDEYFHYLF